MKKTNFNEKFISLIEEANDFLKKNLKVGQKLDLANIEDVDNDLDILNELPFISNVSKHGFYDEYAVLSITRSSEENFTIHTRGKGEASDKEEDFDIAEMQGGELLFLIDVLSEKN